MCLQKNGLVYFDTMHLFTDGEIAIIRVHNNSMNNQMEYTLVMIVDFAAYPTYQMSFSDHRMSLVTKSIAVSAFWMLHITVSSHCVPWSPKCDSRKFENRITKTFVKRRRNLQARNNLDPCTKIKQIDLLMLTIHCELLTPYWDIYLSRHCLR